MENLSNSELFSSIRSRVTDRMEKLKKVVDAAGVKIETEPKRGIQLAPIRPLDDFLLNSARFDIPTQPRWLNRIKKNLLYYQTNYGVLMTLVMLYQWMKHPMEFPVGLIVVTLAIIGSFSYQDLRREFDRRKINPGFVIAGALVFIWFIIITFQSVIVFTTSIAVSALLSILHASLRLRNTWNKVENALYTATLKNTPMALLFDLCGLLVKESED